MFYLGPSWALGSLNGRPSLLSKKFFVMALYRMIGVLYRGAVLQVRLAYEDNLNGYLKAIGMFRVAYES